MARVAVRGDGGAPEAECDEHLRHAAARADEPGVGRAEGRLRFLLAELERLHVLVAVRSRALPPSTIGPSCGRRSGPCASSATQRPPAASAASTGGPRSPPRCVPAWIQVAPRSAGAAQPVTSFSLQDGAEARQGVVALAVGAVAQLADHHVLVESQADRRGELGDRRRQRGVVAACGHSGSQAERRERAHGERAESRRDCARARAPAGRRRPAPSIPTIATLMARQDTGVPTRRAWDATGDHVLDARRRALAGQGAGRRTAPAGRLHRDLGAGHVLARDHAAHRLGRADRRLEHHRADRPGARDRHAPRGRRGSTCRCSAPALRASRRSCWRCARWASSCSRSRSSSSGR